MMRGAFGVERQDGEAVGGQAWIAGSAPDFGSMSRDFLERKFPLPEPSSTVGSGGLGAALHVRRGPNDLWYVVLACWPRFSSRRSVPMWLACKVPIRQFRERMMLAPIALEMLQVLRTMDRERVGAELWCRSRESCEAPAATVEDLRAAVMIDGWAGADHLDFARAPALRGLQVRLEGETDADASGPGRAWALIRMPGGEELQLRAEGRPLLDRRSGVSAPVPPEFRTRGVSDAALVEQVGVFAAIAAALAARPSRGSEPLPRFFQPPVHLLPRSEVRPDEAKAWVEACWRDASRGEREVREIAAGGCEAVAREAGLLARLLCSSPRIAEGPVAMAAWLEETGIVGAMGWMPHRVQRR